MERESVTLSWPLTKVSLKDIGPRPLCYESFAWMLGKPCLLKQDLVICLLVNVVWCFYYADPSDTCKRYFRSSLTAKLASPANGLSMQISIHVSTRSSYPLTTASGKLDASCGQASECFIYVIEVQQELVVRCQIMQLHVVGPLRL